MIKIQAHKISRLKYIIVFLILSTQLSCDSPDANNCFKSAGDEVSKTIELGMFTNILVNRNIEVFIQMGTEYEIEIISGENLIDDITALVVNKELVITDSNTCNLVRDYGYSRVIITAPNLERIRSSTQYDISSIGTLSFSELALVSENFNDPDLFAVGDFRLDLNSSDLTIVSNNISSFYMSGQVAQLNLNFFSGVGRFEGAELISEHIQIYHRGSNDMVLNPQQSIRGEILGTGNAVIVNTPDIIDVQELYVGRLIIQD